MSMEMERSPESSKRNLLSYKAILTTSEPLQAQLAAAISRLALMTGKLLQREVLDGWIQNLESYSSERLIPAFERVEREVAAFPAVSHVVQILDRAEFDAAFALVLRGLPRYGVEWRDREGWKDPDTWDWHSEEAVRLGDRIRVVGKIHPPEPAPVIPARMVRALELFGQTGLMEAGLRRLKRDSPALWTAETEHNPGDHGRIAGAIERELWDCWRRSQ